MRAIVSVLAVIVTVAVTSAHASAMGTLVEYSQGDDPLVSLYALLRSLPFSSLIFY